MKSPGDGNLPDAFTWGGLNKVDRTDKGARGKCRDQGAAGRVGGGAAYHDQLSLRRCGYGVWEVGVGVGCGA